MAQTHDIEDVLSSIRRLVATETGPTARPRLATAERREGPTLVLEDMHRVTEPEDPFQMIRMLAQEERDSRDAEHLTLVVPEGVAAITSDLKDTPEGSDWSAGQEVDDTAEPERDEMSRDETDLATDYAEDADYDATEYGTSTQEAEKNGRDAWLEDMSVPIAAIDDKQIEEAVAPSPKAELAALSNALEGDDALRDLIAEIVRQELAGELGERITRNVRKLVRREIRQMLASDEFD